MWKFLLIVLVLAMCTEALPAIDFVTPTPENYSSIVEPENILINVSIESNQTKNITYNWNGTNYTIYDGSLILMHNMRERTPTHAFDELDVNVWQLIRPENIVIEDGKLRMSANETNGATTAIRTFVNNSFFKNLTNNFSITVYINDTTLNNPSTASGYFAQIAVIGAQTNAQIQFWKGTTGAYSIRYCYNVTCGGAATVGRTVWTNIYRIGNTIQGFYWTGTAWATLGATVNADNSSMQIQLAAFTNGEQAAGRKTNYTFDNIQIFDGNQSVDIPDASIYNYTVRACTYGGGCPIFHNSGYKNSPHYESVNTISYVNTSLSNITGTKLTIEAWIYPLVAPNGATKTAVIISKESGGGLNIGKSIEMRLTSSRRLETIISTGFGGSIIPSLPADPEYNVTSTTAIPLNNWTHVAFTYDGTTMRQYINGTLDSTTATVSVNIGSRAAGLIPVTIGSDVLTPTSPFNGSYDEVRIWNTTRSNADINLSYFSNLQKYNASQWQFTVNQSTKYGRQTYYTSVLDKENIVNTTNIRTFWVCGYGGVGNWIINSTCNLFDYTKIINGNLTVAENGLANISGNSNITLNGTPRWMHLYRGNSLADIFRMHIYNGSGINK